MGACERNEAIGNVAGEREIRSAGKGTGKKARRENEKDETISRSEES